MAIAGGSSMAFNFSRDRDLMEVEITLQTLTLHLGKLVRSTKWHERVDKTYVVAYFSPNCNGENDDDSCKLLTKGEHVVLSAPCFKKPHPSSCLVMELLCTVETAERKQCKHLLGRAYVCFSGLKQKSNNAVTVNFQLPREAYFTAGEATCDVLLKRHPGYQRASDQVWYVGGAVKTIETLARKVAHEALAVFFDSKLMKPIDPALHSFHCPYANNFLPGGFFSMITPVCSHEQRHMQLCLQYGVDAAQLTMEEFTRRCDVQLQSMGQLNQETVDVLRAIASAAVICASVSPYAVDHTLKAVHGDMISGGDCEDKGCAASVWINCLISGPGHRDSTAEWTDPALKAAAQLIRQWYRPVLTIWAVATAALQGAASASQGDSYACHINCVLLPRKVMQGSGLATLKKDEFSSCVTPPDLPPLMLEGTGYLDPLCTPGMVADYGEDAMTSVKAMQKHTNIFSEEVAHALMPRQHANFDGSCSFYKFCVHCDATRSYSTAYEDAVDFYFCKKSGTYGVGWTDFIHNRYSLVPQYVFKNRSEMLQLQDACFSGWAPSSMRAGMPSEELETLMLSKKMNWGQKSDRFVELLGNANDIARIEELISIKNLNVRKDDLYPVGVRTTGYAFTHGTQLVRILVYLRSRTKV